MPAERVQFRPAQLSAPLAARGGDTDAMRGQVAARDLGRYYETLTLALASVELSAGEAGLIVDILNGSHIDVTTAQLLAAEVEDALPDGVAAKWEIDGLALVRKVAGWSLAQRLAVVDAVERFWLVGRVDSTADRLAAVGLLRRG